MNLQRRLLPLVLTSIFPLACLAVSVPAAQLESVRASVEKKSYSRAVDELRPLLAGYPDEAIVHYYAAVCFHHLGKTKDAVEEYGKALETTTDPVIKERCQSILCYFSKLGLAPAGKTAECTGAEKPDATYYLPQGIKLVYFFNPACKTCKSYSVIFDKVKVRFNNTMQCLALDLGAPENQRLVKDYMVEFYPTTVVLNDKGKEVARAEGALEEPVLESFVNKNLTKCLKKR